MLGASERREPHVMWECLWGSTPTAGALAKFSSVKDNSARSGGVLSTLLLQCHGWPSLVCSSAFSRVVASHSMPPPKPPVHALATCPAHLSGAGAASTGAAAAAAGGKVVWFAARKALVLDATSSLTRPCFNRVSRMYVRVKAEEGGGG
jgi:hypothetical protein